MRETGDVALRRRSRLGPACGCRARAYLEPVSTVLSALSLFVAALVVAAAALGASSLIRLLRAAERPTFLLERAGIAPRAYDNHPAETWAAP